MKLAAWNLLLWLKVLSLEPSIVTNLFPGQPLNVHKDAHQLWDGQGRVGVVQLNGHLKQFNTNLC